MFRPLFRTAVAGLLVFGTSASLWAQPPDAGSEEGQTYPQENVERMAQPGPGYDREGQGGEEGQEVPAVEAAGGPEGSQGVTSGSAQIKPQAPGPDFFWVAPYRLPGGRWVPGFWRPRVMAGFEWVNGAWDAKLGVYIPGFWRPVGVVKAGYVWVPGYWYGGRWFPGLWRPATRSGFVWVGGHWTRNGEWVFGHWRPTVIPAGRAWVPGHWTWRGEWVPGHWRVAKRANAVWVPGHHGPRGAWVPGHWRGGPARPAPRRGRHR